MLEERHAILELIARLPPQRKLAANNQRASERLYKPVSGGREWLTSETGTDFGDVCSMSASLIGHSVSSTFRLSATAMSMSLTARASLRNRHQGPSIMGSEDEVEQSLTRSCRQVVATAPEAIFAHGPPPQQVLIRGSLSHQRGDIQPGRTTRPDFSHQSLERPRLWYHQP